MVTNGTEREMNFRNLATYCLRCETMLYWDTTGRPGVLHDGALGMLTCIREGCWLVFVQLPVQSCDFRELDLLKLAFSDAGVPEDIAETGALRLVLAFTAPAAA